MRGSHVYSDGLGICRGYFDQLKLNPRQFGFYFRATQISSCPVSYTFLCSFRLSWIRMSPHLEASIGLLTLLSTSQL